MKTTYDGTGSVSTPALINYLKANNQLWYGNLYAIGIGGFGTAFPNTSWQYFFTDLEYPVQPPFLPAPITASNLGSFVFRPTRMSHDSIEYKVGLDAAYLEATWYTQDTVKTPELALPSGSATISPYIDAFNAQPSTNTVYETFKQAFMSGQLEQAYFCAWRLFMKYPGDVSNFGTCILFNGRLSDVEIARDHVKLKVSSVMELFQNYGPTQWIEPHNRGFQFGYGQSVAIGTGVLQAGTNQSVLVLNGNIANGVLNDGMAFISINPSSSSAFPASATFYRNIRTNTTNGTTTSVYLYRPLPLTVTPGTDQASFYYPLSLSDSAGQNVGPGFPYVPQPDVAL